MPFDFSWLGDAIARGHTQAAAAKRTEAYRAKRRAKNTRARKARRKQRGR